jgi:peptide/nickel transport system substrate-binding protein
VGTGPFRFDNWVQGKSLSTKKWDRYWRKDADGQPLPHLNELEFRPMSDDQQREQAVRMGDVDVALSAAGDIATNLADEFNVIKDYNGQRTYLMLNTAVGDANKGNPFTNVHARRALAYATDRQRIAKIVGQDVQVTTYGFRPDSPWAPKGGDSYFPYDPAQARVEIDKYRRETGASNLTFTLSGLSASETQAVLQGLKANWEEVGITVKIEGNEAAKLTVLTALGQYHATWFRLYDFPDPDQMNFYLAKSNINDVGKLSLNFTHYTSRRLEDNLKILRESQDQTARKTASDDIIRETNDQVLNLWLYDTPESLVARRDVQGLDGFRTHAFANNLPKPWLAEAWLGK